MAESNPSVQSRLIRDLEPAVAIELERHISTTKDWYPHEYVPWSEGRTFAGPLNGR
jgi:acyl-[acyl-carrier-protein] desaturase